MTNVVENILPLGVGDMESHGRSRRNGFFIGTVMQELGKVMGE